MRAAVCLGYGYSGMQLIGNTDNVGLQVKLGAYFTGKGYIWMSRDGGIDKFVWSDIKIFV